jgi:hypothetical protein
LSITLKALDRPAEIADPATEIAARGTRVEVFRAESPARLRGYAADATELVEFT